ncbi:MAG: hypothetical protein ABWX90_00195 [Candidatus Saccharimonadales bacterium]
MLTIRDKLPVKKLVLYGSTAILVGFAGTYTVLREIFPYDRRDNLADANLERKQAASGSAIKPAAETSDNKSTDTSEDALKESGMLVSEAPNATQQPSKNQPLVTPPTNSGSITTAPSASVPQPTPVVTTPAPQPEPQPDPILVVDPLVPPVVPLIENKTEIIIDGVVQP